MKIRSGFVSNSSSSSFILKVGKPFNSALEVAEYMIPKREWKAADAELLTKVRKMMKHSKGQHLAVCFNSCNYDTYIAKMCDYFLISTCHNHSWDLPSVECPYLSEFCEYFGDDFNYLPHCIEFYHIEYNKRGRIVLWQLGYSIRCPVCHEHMWIVEDKLACLNCGEKNPGESI